LCMLPHVRLGVVPGVGGIRLYTTTSFSISRNLHSFIRLACELHIARGLSGHHDRLIDPRRHQNTIRLED